MCQLIFCNLRHQGMNLVALHLLATKASVVNNDGFGIYSPSSGILKTELAAHRINNLGVFMRACVTTAEPVISHVRWASPGIPVTSDNSHPFQSERFVLAHNGRLYGKDEAVNKAVNAQDDTSLGSDSQKFLVSLEETAKKNPEADFAVVLNDTMKEFKGKFAFLIYDKLTKKHYAVRGKTADLCISFLYPGYEEGDEANPPAPKTNLGFVVMTKKADMDEALFTVGNMFGTVFGKQVYFTKAVYLKEETIFELTRTGAQEVGTIKENPTYSASQTTTGTTIIARGGGFTTSKNLVDLSVDHKKLLRIVRYKEEHHLSIFDIDNIFYQVLGFGIADCEKGDIDFFVGSVIPTISASKKMKDIVRRMGVSYFPHDLIAKQFPQLQFPWPLTEVGVMKEIAEWYITKFNIK